MNGSFFYLNYLGLKSIHQLLHLGNQIFWDFEYQVCRLHMFPGDVEVLLLNWHPLVQFDHVRAFVVVGSSEEKGQELDHGGMQFGDVANILKEEVVNPLVRQNELIKLSYHLLKLIVSSNLLEYCCHKTINLSNNNEISIYNQTSISFYSDIPIFLKKFYFLSLNFIKITLIYI